MATPTVIWIKEALAPVIKHQHFTWQRSVLCGAGLAFAFENKKLWHLPAIALVPSVYAGYQAFKSRDTIRAFALNPKSYATSSATEV